MNTSTARNSVRTIAVAKLVKRHPSLSAAELAYTLRRLGDGSLKPYSDHKGICELLSSKFGIDGNLFVRAYSHLWSEFTGDRYYPVPHLFHSPKRAYHLTDNLWGDNYYGDARRHLCLFLAKCLQEERSTENDT